MPFQFRISEFEMDHEAYMSFLIRHHGELNLPYPFAVKLGFIGSPLFLGKAILAIDEDSYEMVGAAGFGYGTGPGDYEDRHVCQIEVAFIADERRRTPLFAQGLGALVRAIKANNPDVSLIQFWISAKESESDRLWDKFLALPGSSRTVEGTLALYRVPFAELEAYCRRLNVGNLQE